LPCSAVRLYPAHDIGSTHGARLTSDFPSVPEQHQRRDTANIDACCGGPLILGVQLRKPQLRLQFGSGLLERRRHHFARPAPGRPEIDDNRDVAAVNVFLKTPIGELGWMAREDLFTALAAFRARCEAISRQAVCGAAVWTNNVF